MAQERSTGRQDAAALDEMLIAQTDAIWPLERPLIERHVDTLGPGPVAVLDVGCGSAEFLARVGDTYSGSLLVGVDPDPANIDVATRKLARFGDRAVLVVGDGAALPPSVKSRTFDIVAIRHVLQAVPRELCGQVVSEAAAVLKPGGLLHVIGEEYAHLLMAHHAAWSEDDVRLAESFSRDGFCPMFVEGGCDGRIGRKLWSMFAGFPALAGRSVEYLAVDSASTEAETLHRMVESWRTGYEEMVSETVPREDAERWFQLVVQAIDEPEGYFAWLLAACQAHRV